jgi:hypothetical protein
VKNLHSLIRKLEELEDGYSEPENEHHCHFEKSRQVKLGLAAGLIADLAQRKNLPAPARKILATRGCA